MVFNCRKSEFMTFGKPMEVRYLSTIKSDLKKYLSTIKSDLEKMLLRVSSLLSYQQKRLYQTLSSVDNSIIVLLFGCSVILGLTKKSAHYLRGLFDHVKMIIPRVMTNF